MGDYVAELVLVKLGIRGDVWGGGGVRGLLIAALLGV